MNLNIKIETEALGEGGIKKWFKFLFNDENRKTTIPSIIAGLTAFILFTPTKVTEKIIDKIFEDTELTNLQKEKIKKEIESLEISNEVKLLENPTIKKKKSNFYEALDNNPEVEKISFQVQSENKNLFRFDKTIFKGDFKNFILTTDEVQSVEIEDATIEIISPVLKKGKFKWAGYYNGEPIYFNMKSIEFKTLIQAGKVEFKNGFSINCALSIKRKTDNEGNIINSGYDVIRVNQYFENDTPIETREGKSHRHKKNKPIQPDLFSSIEDL